MHHTMFRGPMFSWVLKDFENMTYRSVYWKFIGSQDTV